MSTKLWKVVAENYSKGGEKITFSVYAEYPTIAAEKTWAELNARQIHSFEAAIVSCELKQDNIIL